MQIVTVSRPAISELPQASDKPPSLALPSGSIAEAAGVRPAAAAPALALALPVGICGRASGTGMRRLWPTDPDRAWRRGKNGAVPVGGREEPDPDPDTGRAAMAALLLLLVLLLPVAAALQLHPGGGS